jgi:hypothetical protein
MIRFGIVALALVAAMAIFSQPAAAQISRNNPYRSFNLTGVNYGSMQWEAKHKRQSNKSWSTGRSSGRFFRRR